MPFPPHATRPELLLICKKNRPQLQYIVDNTIHVWGHEVVRLPPAHPELKAIEQMWGHMKRQVHSSLHCFTRADLQARLDEARLCVTPELWAGTVRRSQSFEEQYWSTDNIHQSVDPVIINLDSDDEVQLFLESVCTNVCINCHLIICLLPVKVYNELLHKPRYNLHFPFL